MAILFFDSIYLNNHWAECVSIELDEFGVIASIKVGTKIPTGAQHISGAFLPGFCNAHSHAFQYAMAGLSEHLTKDGCHEDFWSWRQTMYRLALKIDPTSMTKIAACLYSEMLRHGITSVAEFHYIHNDFKGNPYANPSEMSQSLIEAAMIAGINLTLIPVYYNTGNFFEKATAEQRRFVIGDSSSYLDLINHLKKLKATDLIVGRGIHSLRAAGKEDIKEILNPTNSEGPLHLHIAEQQKEVHDCLNKLGKRPVHFLMDEVELTERHSLVHATHLDETELKTLAKSPSTIVLCPSTEGNLGDGFFPLSPFLKEGGNIAIGSDSQVGLFFPEEIRWLDYQNRLIKKKRNIVCQSPGDNSGEIFYQKIQLGGRASLGLPRKSLSIGLPLDGIQLNTAHPILYGREKSEWISSLIYAGSIDTIKGVMKRGIWLVEGGLHHKQSQIRSEYAKAMDQLKKAY